MLKKRVHFVRSSWCLSYLLQLFSYNLKLCVFYLLRLEFLRRAEHTNQCQVFPSRFFCVFSRRALSNTFYQTVVSLIPHWHFSWLLERQWHIENFHHRGKFISTRFETREWRTETIESNTFLAKFRVTRRWLLDISLVMLLKDLKMRWLLNASMGRKRSN